MCLDLGSNVEDRASLGLWLRNDWHHHRVWKRRRWVSYLINLNLAFIRSYNLTKLLLHSKGFDHAVRFVLFGGSSSLMIVELKKFAEWAAVCWYILLRRGVSVRAIRRWIIVIVMVEWVIFLHNINCLMLYLLKLLKSPPTWISELRRLLVWTFRDKVIAGVVVLFSHLA